MFWNLLLHSTLWDLRMLICTGPGHFFYLPGSIRMHTECVQNVPHLSFDEHLNCFHNFVIANNVAVNIFVHVSLGPLQEFSQAVFSELFPLDLKYSHCHQTWPYQQPSSRAFPSSLILSVGSIFNFCQYDRCERGYRCFNLISACLLGYFSLTGIQLLVYYVRCQYFLQVSIYFFFRVLLTET